jgi:hypothetical protein
MLPMIEMSIYTMLSVWFSIFLGKIIHWACKDISFRVWTKILMKMDENIEIATKYFLVRNSPKNKLENKKF